MSENPGEYFLRTSDDPIMYALMSFTDEELVEQGFAEELVGQIAFERDVLSRVDAGEDVEVGFLRA